MRVVRVLAILLLVFVVVAVAAGAYIWFDYKDSSRHALARLGIAADSGDWDTVTRYADIEAISDDAAQVLVQQQLEQSGVEGDEGIAGQLGELLADAAEPAVSDAIAQGIQSAIERRSSTTPRRMLGIYYYTAWPQELEVSDESARTVVTVPYRGQRVTFDLTQEWQDGTWRVTKVNNIEEVAAQFTGRR
jgi:hypothetical protein